MNYEFEKFFVYQIKQVVLAHSFQKLKHFAYKSYFVYDEISLRRKFRRFVLTICVYNS